MKIFDIIIAFIFLVIAMLIFFIPEKILSSIKSIQDLLGAICFVLSGVIIRIISLESKNNQNNKEE